MIIYGDSFSSSEFVGTSWPQLVTQMDTHLVKNYATNGSSTEYAMIIFWDFIRKNNHRKDDVFVIQFGTPGRLPFTHQIYNPDTASVFLQDPDKTIYTKDTTWYELNKEHIKWYLENTHHESLLIQHTSYLHLLKTFAANNPTNTVIVLQNGIWTNDIIPIINPPSNFLMPDIDLYKISCDEAFGLEYADFCKYTRYDIRTNHLTFVNRQTLAKLIIEAAETRSIDNFTYDKFAKNIIKPVKNPEDYTKYVKAGILEDKFLSENQFKNT